MDLIDTKMYINKMHNISAKKRSYLNLHSAAQKASTMLVQKDHDIRLFYSLGLRENERQKLWLRNSA